MIPEDASRKENPLPTALARKTLKSEALKSTIQNIVRANNDFNRQHESLKGRPLEGHCSSPPIEITPKEIVFESVSVGLDYFTTLVVTNLTAKQKKVKIRQPKNSVFTFENSETTLVAPGIQFRCRVFFKCRTAEEVHETFSVISDQYAIEVPVSVYPPRGVLSFEPTVNLGFVQLENPTAFKVRFKNTGTSQLTLDMMANEEMSVTSGSFPLTIPEQCTATATFEAVFSRTGVFQSSIVLAQQGTPTRHSVEVSATAVAFANFLVDEKGNEVSVLSFDEVLLGDVRAKRVTLINNSPGPPPSECRS
jgi:hypothetical protein